MDLKNKKVPPDGGWGYMVVAATAAMGFLGFPVVQNFGLLFRPIFEELELTGPEISTIIGVNSGSGFVFGLFHGPLVKAFGYRIYAMIGTLLSFAGLLATTFSTTVVGFVAFYGILTSIGFCITHNAFVFALNSYFVKKRTFAVGLAFMIAGIGSVIMPLVMSKAILFYGSRGTALVICGMLLNVFAAALLLQPVKWHYKIEGGVEDGRELEPMNREKGRTNAEERPKENGNANVTVKEGLEETDPEKTPLKPDPVPEEVAKKPDPTCWNTVVTLFDLDLLKDPVLLSIIIGLSFAFTGEVTFSSMYPVVLGDKGFDLDETAFIISTTAGVDIIFRIIVPFVEKLLKWRTRDMYMLTLIMLITSRFTLTLVSEFWDTMLVAAFLGVAKGFRTVYMTIVLANYVPIEKLPSAQGLQTVFNGLLLLSIGPFVGKLKNLHGNFDVVIYLTNIMSLITLIIWAVERLIELLLSKSKNNSKRHQYNELQTRQPR